MAEYVCKFCAKICKNENSLRNHERLCRANKDRQLTTFEKYGSIKGFNNPGRTAWNKGLTKENSSSMAKLSNTLHEKYVSGNLQIYNPMVSNTTRIAHRAAMKRAYSGYTRRTPGKFKYGYYNGIWCDSSWELAYLLYCKLNNIIVSRNKTGFSYS